MMRIAVTYDNGNVFQHFGNGQVLVLVDVGLINSIPLHLC